MISNMKNNHHDLKEEAYYIHDMILDLRVYSDAINDRCVWLFSLQLKQLSRMITCFSGKAILFKMKEIENNNNEKGRKNDGYPYRWRQIINGWYLIIQQIVHCTEEWMWRNTQQQYRTIVLWLYFLNKLSIALQSN